MDIATHKPAPGADYVIRVDLADHGMPGRSEQIWVEQVGSNRFVVRSLPFFSYGIRPGDTVETDSSYTVRRVIKQSGKQVLRIAVEPQAVDRIQRPLHEVLEELALPHEWHRDGYVAVELADEEIPERLTTLLDEGRGELHHEFG